MYPNGDQPVSLRWIDISYDVQNLEVAEALFLNGPEHPMKPSEATQVVHLLAEQYSLLPLLSYIILLTALILFLCFFLNDDDD